VEHSVPTLVLWTGLEFGHGAVFLLAENEPQPDWILGATAKASAVGIPALFDEARVNAHHDLDPNVVELVNL
jgi:hypothetical protein